MHILLRVSEFGTHKIIAKRHYSCHYSVTNKISFPFKSTAHNSHLQVGHT